jgi:hypothetical protein
VGSLILGTFRIKKKKAADDAIVNALQGRYSRSLYLVFVIVITEYGCKATALRNCIPLLLLKKV